MSKATEQSPAGEPRVVLIEALTHFIVCLSLSYVCRFLGGVLQSRGDFTDAKAFCAGALLNISGIELLFLSAAGLAFLPKGRWRGWRQPLAIAIWIALGALISGLLEITVNLKPIESLLLLVWITWLPAFWLVKPVINQYLEVLNE